MGAIVLTRKQLQELLIYGKTDILGETIMLENDIDLPIEKPKDKEIRKVAVLQKSHLDRETVLMFKDEYLDNQGAFADHFYLGDVEYHPSMILTYKHKPKKKLVTKDAKLLSWIHATYEDELTFGIPRGKKILNPKCTYEVEE